MKGGRPTNVVLLRDHNTTSSSFVESSRALELTK